MVVSCSAVGSNNDLNFTSREVDTTAPWVFGLVVQRSNDTAHAAVLSVADELDDGVGFAICLCGRARRLVQRSDLASKLL